MSGSPEVATQNFTRCPLRQRLGQALRLEYGFIFRSDGDQHRFLLFDPERYVNTQALAAHPPSSVTLVALDDHHIDLRGPAVDLIRLIETFRH